MSPRRVTTANSIITGRAVDSSARYLSFANSPTAPLIRRLSSGLAVGLTSMAHLIMVWRHLELQILPLLWALYGLMLLALALTLAELVVGERATETTATSI